MSFVHYSLLSLLVLGGLGGAATGEDWPTFGNSATRNAATDEVLEMPLATAWIHRADHPPQRMVSTSRSFLIPSLVSAKS